MKEQEQRPFEMERHKGASVLGRTRDLARLEVRATKDQKTAIGSVILKPAYVITWPSILLVRTCRVVTSLPTSQFPLPTSHSLASHQQFGEQRQPCSANHSLMPEA